MTVQTVPPAIAAVGTGISGITTATDPPPAAIETAQLPCLFTFTGEATYEWGDDHGYETRVYRVQVAVIPRVQATPETREVRCRPLIVAVRNALASSPQIGAVARVLGAKVIGDSGPAVLPEFEMKYIGFEVRLEVLSIVARVYDAGE